MKPLIDRVLKAIAAVNLQAGLYPQDDDTVSMRCSCVCGYCVCSERAATVQEAVEAFAPLFASRLKSGLGCVTYVPEEQRNKALKILAGE